MKYYCGIDSGKAGAISVISADGKIVETYVMPLKGKDLDLDKLSGIIRGLDSVYHPLFVLEKLQPIFGAGKSSMWSMCGTFHTILGMLHAHDVNYIQIVPKNWQKIVILPEDGDGKLSSGKKDPKLKSMNAIKRLYPNEVDKLIYASKEKITGRKKKLNEGICESILIAYSQINNI